MVEFIARLRGEQRFADVGQLVDQIRSDIKAARRLLETTELDARPFFFTSIK